MNHSTASNTNLQKLGNEVISIIYIFAVISSISLCLDFYVYSEMNVASQYSFFLDTSFNKLLQFFYFVEFLMFYVSLLGIIWFIHKSQLYNLERGVKDLKYSPTWIGIWWFIPVLNFWMPLRVVRETYLASFQVKKNKLGLDAKQTFLGWWGCWVIASIFDGLTITFYRYDLIEVAYTLESLIKFLYICSALSFIGIIKSIYSNQLETSQNKL